MQGQDRDRSNVLSLLGALVATSLVMGLLAAGIMIPAVGAVGAVAKSGVDVFDSLPGDFKSTPLSQQSRILDSKGGLITTPYYENRIIVPLRRINPWMQKAQIAIEDSRFYQHGGIDPKGITRALVSNFNGGDISQGASTLTQQYVKITLQENALREGDRAAANAAIAKTYTRKLQEMKYAVTLEQTLTKDQILEGYLNLVYYGDKAYGVEAAARHYFGVPASKLNLAQAATLAGVVQRPGSTDPRSNPAAAQQRRDVVLDRMLQLGIINLQQKKAAQALPVTKMLHITDDRANTCSVSKEPYFCTYILAWLKDTSNHSLDFLGKSVPERVNSLNRGGLTIRTTLDPELQSKARAKLLETVPIGNGYQIGGAATVVEPGTGRVLSMVQASRFPDANKKGQTRAKGYTEQNWNVDTAYNGTTGFQFGSTAKMYAVVTALQNGVPINGDVFADAATTKAGHVYSPSVYKDSCGTGQPWEVRNDEVTASGNIPFRKAVANSVNTAFAHLVIGLGACKVRKNMTAMGLHEGGGNPILPNIAPITLGADDVTPLTIASSYATLAADGKYCLPNPIQSITTNDKKTIKLPGPDCKQVISPQIARGATELLKGVIASGTGVGAKLAGGRPAAGKTGTTDNHVESWFVGYTRQLATAVWVGTPYSQQRMKDISLGGRSYHEVFGGTIAAPLWAKIMDIASEGMPFENFPSTTDKIANGDLVAIPNVAGKSFDEAKAILRAAGFDAAVAGEVNSSVPRGLVVSTNPSGHAVQGATIGLILSTGVVPQQGPSKPTTTPKPGRTKPPKP